MIKKGEEEEEEGGEEMERGRRRGERGGKVEGEGSVPHVPHVDINMHHLYKTSYHIAGKNMYTCN